MPASPRALAIHGVAFAGGAGFAFARGLFGLGRVLGPRHQVARGGEPGHVHADLGDEFLGSGLADAGDLIELGHLVCERGDHFIDPLGQRLGLGGQRIHAVEHHASR